MATIDVLIGIDGTHDNPVLDISPKDYDAQFKTSHVRHIIKNSRFAAERSHYIRGPAGVGTYVNDRFEEALAHLDRHAGGGDAIRLHLAGFSRGAAIALDLANAFSLPPQGLLSELGRLLTFGKTTSVVARIGMLRSKLAGRITVSSVALFDPVDMSTDIDGDPIGRNILNAAVTRRSIGWGSRSGWTNVGDMTQTPAAGPRGHFVINGTHGAMGGMPGAGDIPKPLARELLRLLPRSADWDRVERRHRGQPLERVAVRAALTAPGLFVNPANGGLMGAAAHLGRQWLGKVADNVADAAVVQTYRRKLELYAKEGGAMKGTVSMGLNQSLGSFPGIDLYFRDFKPCLNRIADYRMRDRQASDASRLLMRTALGQAWPAKD